MAHVFPHHTHVGIPGHLLIDGLPQGVEQQRLCHVEIGFSGGQPISDSALEPDFQLQKFPRPSLQ